jgi:hypothetical protein
MIFDREIKALATRIGRGGSDKDIRELVIRLAEACTRQESRRRYDNNLASTQHAGAYPVDDEGYAIAFDPLEDEEAFVDAWQRYGIVVGKSILTQDECRQTIESIKTKFNTLSGGRCDLDNPHTWATMPKDNNGTPLLSRGFLEIYHDDALAQIRQNVRAYMHHVLIWGRADLWTSFDRVGVKLPHHEESKALPLHVDQNPTVHPGFKTVQGVLALTDCPAERGTFMGVPGSRTIFPQYAAMAKNKGEYVEFDATALDPALARDLQSRAQPIPLRAGDFVSWDSRTTHANTENISDDMRMVLYMAAGPAREDHADAVSARRDALRTGIGSNVREALMHASKKPRYTNPDALSAIRRPERLNLLGKLLYGTENYEKTAASPAP